MPIENRQSPAARIPHTRRLVTVCSCSIKIERGGSAILILLRDDNVLRLFQFRADEDQGRDNLGNANKFNDRFPVPGLYKWRLRQDSRVAQSEKEKYPKGFSRL